MEIVYATKDLKSIVFTIVKLLLFNLVEKTPTESSKNVWNLSKNYLAAMADFSFIYSWHRGAIPRQTKLNREVIKNHCR